MTNTAKHNDLVTISLHWLIAFAVMGMLGFGLYLRYIAPDAGKASLDDVHRVLGTLVLFLAAARVLWSIGQRRLVETKTRSAWENNLAMVVHLTLLIGTLAMPLSGIAMTVGHGQPVNVFGLFQFGPFMAPNHSLGELGSSLHSKIGKLMLLAIGLHIAGALKHHFIDGTVALRRMLGSQISVAD